MVYGFVTGNDSTRDPPARLPVSNPCAARAQGAADVPGGHRPSRGLPRSDARGTAPARTRAASRRLRPVPGLSPNLPEDTGPDRTRRPRGHAAGAALAPPGLPSRARAPGRDLGLEAIALTVDGQDVGGPLGVRLELLPEPQHVGVDRAGRGKALVAPDRVEESLASEDLAGALDEVAEQLELLPCEPYLAARR